ncbi:choline/ethanolamine kinase [Cylas formicarius]|uniref:choline/ethanolamine kinase n=1 Tax=Cylas formicarius TaxID=197179 RepID=UPI0029586B8F|nr:choline/ethanolamine kinase [Cylas formicarius]
MLNTRNTKMHGDSFEMKDLTARICREYLHGAWKKVTPHDIGFKHISGGLSNLLYHVALPPYLIDDSKGHSCHEPKEVLIRVYGQTHGEGALEALITESVIFTLLSERGLGPKLHGIFPGGRIEQYINARPLLTRELAIPKLSVLIAQKMAQIHSMEVPLHKEPDWLWNTMDRWLKTCEKKLAGDVPEFARDLLDKVDLNAETRWLKETLERENSPVVFCHNDMQEGNILMSPDADKDEDPRIVIIDFEYCSYNYRGFDIANHFVEWIYDYKEETSYPFYTENPRHYPTEKQRLTFIRAYLDESGSRENVTKVLREVEVFTLASHLFWTLWGIINAETSKIPFGYWEYGVSRLSNYLRLKERLSCNTKIKRKVECLSLD